MPPSTPEPLKYSHVAAGRHALPFHSPLTSPASYYLCDLCALCGEKTIFHPPTHMPDCPDCGFPVSRQQSACPKCDLDLAAVRARKPLVIDLAHRGETVSQALDKLEKALSECLWNGHPALKVIHGSGGGSSRIRPHIIAALKKHAARHGGTLHPDADNPGCHLLSF